MATSKSQHREQAQGLIRQGGFLEGRAEGERGKQRVITLILAYGEYQKGAIEGLNGEDPGLVEASRDSSLRVLRAIEPLLAKRKRKKPRGRSVIE